MGPKRKTMYIIIYISISNLEKPDGIAKINNRKRKHGAIANPSQKNNLQASFRFSPTFDGLNNKKKNRKFCNRPNRDLLNGLKNNNGLVYLLF